MLDKPVHLKPGIVIRTSESEKNQLILIILDNFWRKLYHFHNNFAIKTITEF